jgi:hypothetical protein
LILYAISAIALWRMNLTPEAFQSTKDSFKFFVLAVQLAKFFQPSKENYLSAMLQVYGEMWKVLKDGGTACVVIKPFIRNKKPVDLPYQTWLLLEKVGFKLKDVLKFRLPQQSFWRILQYRKYPDVPHINHEYVVICQKAKNLIDIG